MAKKALTLSIVIPVYNEQHHIRACLEAIAKQTVKPLEIIVVDNNSTDATSEIARAYPFVKVIKEPLQGRASARTTGFNKARGDIIGRIDADSVVMPAWVERVLQDFQDPDVQAITGLGRTLTLPRIKHLHTTLWPRVYYWIVHGYFGTVTTWGANMAVRRSIWEKVKYDVCLDDQLVHEDQDVSLLIAGHGGKIWQDNKLLITTNGQSYHYWPKFYEYVRLAFFTKDRHKKLGTLNQKNASRVSKWHVLLSLTLIILFAVPFAAVSLLLWPVDTAFIRLSSNSDAWLE